jgi:hypothetical protein
MSCVCLPMSQKTPTRKHKAPTKKPKHFNDHDYQHKRYVKFGGKL